MIMGVLVIMMWWRRSFTTLTGDSLNEDLFATWWANTELVNDFWIELPHKLVRVHITPRRRFFDPQEVGDKPNPSP